MAMLVLPSLAVSSYQHFCSRYELDAWRRAPGLLPLCPALTAPAPVLLLGRRSSRIIALCAVVAIFATVFSILYTESYPDCEYVWVGVCGTYCGSPFLAHAPPPLSFSRHPLPLQLVRLPGLCGLCP